MNLNILQAFRHRLYECLERGADGLFNLADALLSQPQAQSLAQLSLSPFFQRGWPSLYQAIQDGRIATDKLEELFATFVPTPPAGEPMLLGLDSSSIARPLSPTAADRTPVYVPNLPPDSTKVDPRLAVFGAGGSAAGSQQLGLPALPSAHCQHADGWAGRSRATARTGAALGAIFQRAGHRRR
jgi:hypothetical protein